jgi:iron complex transport system ATP-binding protein
MLEARSLAFGFPGRTIGRGIDLAVAPGEVLCVLGPNGGGKTTLFRTLLGLLDAREGEVLLDGRPLRTLSRAEVASVAGYVPQGHTAYFAFTLREFVLMGRTSRLGSFASPGDADRRVADRVLESLGLGALAGRPVTEISGGERQLALLARALAQEPRLLVMDEPTANLDFGNRLRVLERISALADSGISILFSSHDPDQALRYADRALLLGEGRALEVGAPEAVVRPDTLERLYGVAVEVVALAGGRHACLPPPSTKERRA